MKQIICRWIRFFGVSLLATLSNIYSLHAGTAATELVLPVANGGVKALYEYYDAAGALNLAYEKNYSDKPSDFFHIAYSDGRWSTPYLIPVLHQNARTLRGVVNLSNGTPLLVMNSDNTDYKKVFNITDTTALDENGVPSGLGITPEHLSRILTEGQRLFFIMQIGGRWTSPMPIPESTMVTQATVTAGSDGSALVVFSRDIDKDFNTLADRELYASVYSNHLWSRPVKLTVNTQVEYSIQAVSVGGEYVVTWVTDKDGDVKKRDDSELDYAVVSSSGGLTKSASAVTAKLQNNPAPVLGADGEQAVLLWTSATSADSTQRGVWEARFGNAWSSPEDTGLQVDYLLGGALKRTPEGFLLVFKDRGAAKVSLDEDGKWHEPVAMFSVDGTGFEYSNYRLFTDKNKNLWMAGAANVALGDDHAGTGLYVWHEPLNQDLVITDTRDLPFIKKLGTEGKLIWSVSNKGALLSTGYRAEVYRNDAKVSEFDGNALAPGESEQLEYPFTLDAVQIPFDIKLVAQAQDREDNNSATHIVNINPDFDVRSVTHPDATHFTADIIEKKGVVAPAVDVGFYLIEDGKPTLIAKGEYDPSSGLPLTVETKELVDRVDPYQVLVKVNAEHKVKEDTYSNNQSSYIYRPQPDFQVKQLYLTGTSVHVTIRNSGMQRATKVDVLLTDDPVVAGQSTQGGTPWLYQQVTLDEGGEAELDISRADKTELSGEMLYAVVNPYGIQPESDRNNNTKKVSIRSPSQDGGTGGAGGGSGLQGPALTFARIGPWCSSLQVDVENKGGAPAIASRLEMISSSGYLVTTEALPVVMPDTTESVTLRDLSAGTYALKLVYAGADGTEQHISGNATINPGAYCRRIAGNDVRIVSLQKTQMTDRMHVVVTVGAVGYELNYRKPLLRVPVILEAKRGITRLYHAEQVAYLGSGSQEDAQELIYEIPLEGMSSGKLQLKARIPVRDDETKEENNVQYMDVEMGNDQ